MMLRGFQRLVAAAALVLPAALPAFAAPEADPPTGDDLAPVLETIRAKYQLPGLAAAVVRGDRVVAAGAVGVREAGKEARLELGDRLHIGSCTKTMTAMLIARLVDRGKLKWETTLAEALPGVEMRPEYRPVTIRQLLTFRGGIPPYTLFKPGGPAVATMNRLEGDDPAAVRLQFARLVLNEPPVAAQGARPVYSNAAFAIAGAIVDRLAGRPYETELVEGLFRPLAMTTAVVGQPRQGGVENNQPAGHRKEGDVFRPALPPPMDSRPGRFAMTPAGNVSCSILDFARYAAARLAGLRGGGPLLSAEAYAAIAQSDETDDGFTGGTGRVRTLDKGGREYLANGSGGLFLAGFRLLPDQDSAIVVAMNGMDPEALEAVVAALKERYVLPR
jgi:CubicO group peptidase (beta-lactamase class C family)